MNNKPLLIALVAILIITFSAVPSARANPLLIVAIPLTMILSAAGFFAQDVHEDRQMAKAKDINNSEEEKLVVKRDDQTAK